MSGDWDVSVNDRANITATKYSLTKTTTKENHLLTVKRARHAGLILNVPTFYIYCVLEQSVCNQSNQFSDGSSREMRRRTAWWK